MELQQSKQQIVDLFKKSNKFLIISSSVNAGSIGSMLALSQALIKLGKETTIFSTNLVPEKYLYLPNSADIKTDISGLKTFVIAISTQNAKIDKLGYNIEDSKLKIHITPKQGQITQQDISFEESKNSFDAIVVVNTLKPDDLGSFYDQNSDLFFSVPVINIDYKSGNNYFGKINYVDTKATSTSETMLSIIESLSGDKPLIDEPIATNLLSALIEDTNSFQSISTTPKSFSIAAQLIGAGAKKQDIINNLFDRKSVSNLRLWGRILAGLREDSVNKILWAVVTDRDLEQTNSSSNDLENCLPEFLSSTKSADAAFLLYEKQGQIFVELQTNGTIEASDIATSFNASGSDTYASFPIMTTGIASAEKEIIDKIKGLKANS
jgi:phosphoesterase RecJ-like protein